MLSYFNKKYGLDGLKSSLMRIPLLRLKTGFIHQINCVDLNIGSGGGNSRFSIGDSKQQTHNKTFTKTETKERKQKRKKD